MWERASESRCVYACELGHNSSCREGGGEGGGRELDCMSPCVHVVGSYNTSSGPGQGHVYG